MIAADELFDAYFKALASSDKMLCRAYTNDKAWTSRATHALVETGRLVMQDVEEATVAAKGHPDHYGYSEYLGIDVTWYDDRVWRGPIFIAEHENRYISQIQYAAWKLLVVEAEYRMLVAYFGDDSEVEDFEHLKRLVAETCADHSGKSILLVGGPYGASPSSTKELIELHQTAVVGINGV